MSLRRTLYNTYTAPIRWWHRHGFGVQSPSDYELVRDVLFEPLSYYAYQDQGIDTKQSQQLYRIRLWRPHAIVIERAVDYEDTARTATDQTTVVVEHITGCNEPLWQQILTDPRARVTFDMKDRGLVLFDKKRIKQNYIL